MFIAGSQGHKDHVQGHLRYQKNIMILTSMVPATTVINIHILGTYVGIFILMYLPKVRLDFYLEAKSDTRSSNIVKVSVFHFLQLLGDILICI